MLANGLAGNTLIEWKDGDYEIFVAALGPCVPPFLARSIAADGEGCNADHLPHVRRPQRGERRRLGQVGGGLLLGEGGHVWPTPMGPGAVRHGGTLKAPFRPEHVDVTFRSAAGELLVCKQGEAVDFDEAKAKEVLSQKEVIIAVDLHEGRTARSAGAAT